MDYWRNAFEGRGLLFYDHTELQGVDDDDYTSNITNPSKSVHEWDDMKPLSDFGKNITNPNDLDLPESVFPDILPNSVSSEPSLGCLATEISNDSCKPVSSIPVQSEFGSKSRKGKLPCPTELKFEGLAYSGELKLHKILKDGPNSKKARKDNIPSTPIYACQVHGCDRDLSCSKEYYRRHKVCDIHSKTPLVLINGIEKRFCQQCSRFHLLDEFDDGKRSCRKRLAGHNARRRKAAVVTEYAKSNFLQFCQGSQKNGGEESMSMYTNASRAHSFLSAEEWQSLSSRSSACIPTSVPMGMPPPDQNPDHRWIHHQSSSSSSAVAVTNGVTHEQQSLTGSYFDRLGARMVPEFYNGGVANIDLNQLSAHLQRVEQQRNYVLMKPENYLF